MELSAIANWFINNLAVFGLLVLAGVANAVMDKIQFHLKKSIFSDLGIWFNPNLSWKLKWKLDTKGEPIVGTPKFFGSSTFLVFLTDGWHFMQMVMLSLMTISIFFYTPFVKDWWIYLVDFIAFKATFGIAFEICFRWVFTKK